MQRCKPIKPQEIITQGVGDNYRRRRYRFIKALEVSTGGAGIDSSRHRR